MTKYEITKKWEIEAKNIKDAIKKSQSVKDCEYIEINKIEPDKPRKIGY